MVDPKGIAVNNKISKFKTCSLVVTDSEEK